MQSSSSSEVAGSVVTLQKDEVFREAFRTYIFIRICPGLGHKATLGHKVTSNCAGILMVQSFGLSHSPILFSNPQIYNRNIAGTTCNTANPEQTPNYLFSPLFLLGRGKDRDWKKAQFRDASVSGVLKSKQLPFGIAGT